MCKKLRQIGQILLIVLVLTEVQAQNLRQAAVQPLPDADRINWQKPLGFKKQGRNYQALAFDGIGYYETKDYLPYLTLSAPCAGSKLEPVIEVVETAALSPDEEACVNKLYLTGEFEISETNVLYETKVPYTIAKLVPLRLRNGKTEKLLAYRVRWQASGQPVREQQSAASALFATSSVLAGGNWYRIGTTEDAVYKIDRAFLQKLGINVSTIDPRNIKLYGNGGEMLAEPNGSYHPDDLNENAIYVQGESDGSFDNSDYILFYGQSPHKWKYAPGKNACTRYTRSKHYYSDSTFYFLTVGSTPGKRIQQQSSAGLTPNYTVTSFDDPQAHELDAANLVKSGREMYGENFENTPSYSFGFNFPNIMADTVWLKTSILGRRVDNGTGVPPGAFDITYPGGGSYQVTFPVTCADFDCDVGKDLIGCTGKSFVYGGGSTAINLTITRSYADEAGWLNYVWVIARRALTMAGNQMQFMDYRSVAPGTISQYNLQSPLSALRVWNVTKPYDISEQLTSFSGGVHSFAVPTDTLQTFIAFDGNSFKTPSFSARVNNQNLHGLQSTDLVVLAYPGFLNQAAEVAKLHEQKEKYSYVIVTPQEIYNEFSSGAQDIMAIRMFLRMLYKRATPGAEPKHLLIYGDGSYLYKDVTANTNFVPTYQTSNSSSFISSKCGDDFYGLLDDNEGQFDCCGNPDGLIDIGIGRLPVHSNAEADVVMNKILSYYARKSLTASGCDAVSTNAEDWRNWVCLIADDPNPGGLWETTFLTQSESFASNIGANKRYNIDKIYEDSYKAVSVPGGRRYPDVVTAINNRVERGALLIGYSGHGGELGLSHEEIITVNQIQNWKNANNLPLFFTATCEFSRFDDAGRTSAGEYILLNPNGGGIALFTTTRLAFASDGISLGSIFYPAAVNKLSNGKYPALGDIIKKTKRAQPNYLHFALLGDPALTLSYPRENVSTYKINSNLTVSGVNDTLSALGKYTVTGFIADTNGNKITSFNGHIYPTIYDKPVLLSTLDNSGNGPAAILNFYLQKNALYRGKASVVNGDFSFSFIVPKDIFYNYGLGKISYFAQSDTMDAAGYWSQIVVGGTSSSPVSDNAGPSVKLFMNDNQFVQGGITDESPYIYAEVSDSSGINTTGNGLGHDIVATLDANTARAYVLNDYYQADLNKYQSGKVKYQLSSLTEGTHHLNIKVWDILNNSSTSATDFVVSKSAEMALAHVLNYPNPFSTSTRFFVEHNQACNELDVQVQIFTITGRIVKTLQETVHNEGFRTTGIAWDGRDDFGDKLGRGVYIYKVTVKNATGSKADKIEKLVILN
jgi:hypothetical protein